MTLILDGQTVDIPGGGLPEGTIAIKPLTRAEYNALTDEEKQADVAYAITDDPPVSGGPWDIYSEEEVRVGTWIDGKPLYRKVFAATFGLNAKWTAVEGIEDLDFLVKATGLYAIDAINFVAPNPVSYLGSMLVNDVRMMGINAQSSALYGKSITIIAEYTKTTDTGGAR